LAAVSVDTIASAGGSNTGGYTPPLTDDTNNSGVDTKLAAVSVDTTAFAGGSNTGGYTPPFTDDTKSAGVDTCTAAVSVDTTRFGDNGVCAGGYAAPLIVLSPVIAFDAPESNDI